MKNRFNRLTSKEWLPFQKSWFRYSTNDNLYRENIRFFCKAEKSDSVAFYYGNDPQLMSDICNQNDVIFHYSENVLENSVEFAFLDLRHEVNRTTSQSAYIETKDRILSLCKELFDKLENRRFLTVLIPNVQKENGYFPFAWDLAQNIASVFTLKDEKIACVEESDGSLSQSLFRPEKNTFYCLYFRKDENSSGNMETEISDYFYNIHQIDAEKAFQVTLPSWFILKPQPRKKNEILHPAKYPEELVQMCVETFTQPDQNIFDPMSGTGSTQIGALKSGRNGYGTELSPFFAEIAQSRCSELLQPKQSALFGSPVNQKCMVLNKDARDVKKDDFPLIDYLLTSPPYWDMLNMKGAENQAKRIEKGLQTNYSDDLSDLGNIADYHSFLNDLTEIYFNISEFVKPGGYFTIVVKNIKKKGKNYPFAWDLAARLQQKLILLPEVFWCQDDISIAPYGYGNTFVSNTFHQYCLNFQKPKNI
ncbi:MAG: hypothetical protein IPM42_00555 [Saprospiraceae bacterium]|nr:hypothetical protein [Saprospiraceae bacterium]